MARVIYITGTDTGAGKTLLTALLLRELRRHDRRVMAMKPFATGSRRDARVLARVPGGTLPEDALNPFFFRRPTVPLAAARAENRAVSLTEALSRIQAAAAASNGLLIEGCGGLLVPLGEGFTLLDIMVALSGPVIIAARNRLGVINQVRLTCEVLRQRGIHPRACVLMGCPRDDLSASGNAGMLAEVAAPLKVLTIPYLGVVNEIRRLPRAGCKKVKKTLALLGGFATLRSLAAGGPVVEVKRASQT
jgi:dethiobiotin synthase